MKMMAMIVSTLTISPFREWWTIIAIDGPSNVSGGTQGPDFEDAVDVRENSVGDD